MFHGKIKSKLDIYVFITEMIPGRLFVSDMRQVGGFYWDDTSTGRLFVSDMRQVGGFHWDDTW